MGDGRWAEERKLFFEPITYSLEPIACAALVAPRRDVAGEFAERIGLRIERRQPADRTLGAFIGHFFAPSTP